MLETAIIITVMAGNKMIQTAGIIRVFSVVSNNRNGFIGLPNKAKKEEYP